MASAWRTVVRLFAKRVASSCSPGRREPLSCKPVRISAASVSAIVSCFSFISVGALVVEENEDGTRGPHKRDLVAHADSRCCDTSVRSPDAKLEAEGFDHIERGIARECNRTQPAE